MFFYTKLFMYDGAFLVEFVALRGRIRKLVFYPQSDPGQW